MPQRLLFLPAPVDDLIRRPELDGADYVRQVLNQSDGATEVDIDQELMAKAAALGIELPISRRSSTQDQRSPGSNSGDASNLQHTRTVSVGSGQHANMGPASQTSNRATADSPPTLTEALDRRRPESLSFSQYDKYIEQADLVLDQPKFVKPNRQKARWSAGSMARPGSRKRVMVFTRGLVMRLRRRGPSLSMPM
jgi:hypothetical protein